MALITPSSLSYVVELSILSRILVFFIQLISNFILVEHAADAYRNRYHYMLTNRTSDITLSDTYWYTFKSIQGFTKWDAQYFLEISNDGYVSEQHLAFLPLFPVIVSTIKQLLFGHSKINLDHFQPTSRPTLRNDLVSVAQVENYIKSAIVGFSLNNFVFFPLASLSLFALTKLVKGRDEKYARNVVWWFCFNPASIFFSSCYTESLFSMLTFTAMFLMEYKSEYYLTTRDGADGAKEKLLTQKDEFKPIKDLNRLLRVCLPALAPMALSSATRSNALVTIGFIIYQFLLKYSTLIHTRRSNWSLMLYIAFVLEILQDALVMIMSSVVAASGYITFQIYSYIRFCIEDSNKERGTLNLRPDWCNNKIPHPYGQVQAKYWNVGLFKYYQAKQLPNFLLALPLSYIALTGSLDLSKVVAKERTGKKQLGYYIQTIILTIICSITINVQVTTRLLASSCPAIYWICTETSRTNRFRSKIILFNFISYFVIGTMLHTNFYPWT